MTNSFPNFPSFSNGTLSLNGNVKASTAKKGNTVNSNFNLSDFENKALEYVQKTLAEKMPELNVFSADVLKSINSQTEAYKNKAIDTLNKMYEPILNNLKNDIASRFGSFSNSSFLNNLDNIESKRADAMTSLAQNVEEQRSQLENNELAKRYAYLNFLNDYQNNLYNNILKSIGITQQNSNMGNSYNANAYSNEYSKFLNNQKNQATTSSTNDYLNQIILSTLLTSFL